MMLEGRAWFWGTTQGTSAPTEKMDYNPGYLQMLVGKAGDGIAEPSDE